MKVLVVRGSPRKNGATARLAALFVRGLRGGGAEVFDADLTSLKISPCLGCFHCVRSGGVCALRDDMRGLLETLAASDALVCASPVYFYSMSAQTKAFFDRCFPLVRGYAYDAEKGRCACIAASARKKLITIGAASGRISSFDALSKTYAAIADSMNMEYAADIRRGETPYFGALGARSARVRRILDSFVEAGRAFAETGAIPSEIVAAAESEIAENDRVFASRSKIFWELLKNGKTF